MKIPLVLLSGLLSNEALWSHQMAHLTDLASIQVFSPFQNSVEKMVQPILDKAPPVFALAGHSMGGWLCLEIMKRAPSRVSRLCLLNTTSRLDPEEKKIKRQKMMLKAQSGHFEEVVEALLDRFVFNPLMKSAVRTMFFDLGPSVFVSQQESMLKREECESVLPHISCPTMVIHAVEDKNFSLEEHRELSSQIKGARLKLVEGSGHMSPMEKPEAITGLLRQWLAL